MVRPSQLTPMQKLLLAISLPITLVFFYFLFRRSDDEDDEEADAGAVTSRQTTIEVKVPHDAVGAVTGVQGAQIKMIKSATKAHLNFKDKRTDFGHDRVLTIQGTPEGAEKAELMVRQIIANQREIVTTVIQVPNYSVGRIIGRSGETIRLIAHQSKAKINVEKTNSLDPEAVVQVELKGTPIAVDAAKKLILDIVEDDQNKRQKEASEQTEQMILCPDSALAEGNDSIVKVYISAVDHPGHFWVQHLDRGAQQLTKLVHDMTAFYGEFNRPSGDKVKPVVGELVAAPFPERNSWYRAQVLGVVGDDVEVRFVDYGDSLVVSKKIIRKLRDNFKELSFQAKECCLADVIPSNRYDWSEEAIVAFKDLVHVAKWKVLMSQNTGVTTSDLPQLQLVDTAGEKGVGVAEELVKRGLAIWSPPIAFPSSQPSILTQSTGFDYDLKLGEYRTDLAAGEMDSVLAHGVCFSYDSKSAARDNNKLLENSLESNVSYASVPSAFDHGYFSTDFGGLPAYDVQVGPYEGFCDHLVGNSYYCDEDQDEEYNQISCYRSSSSDLFSVPPSDEASLIRGLESRHLEETSLENSVKVQNIDDNGDMEITATLSDTQLVNPPHPELPIVERPVEAPVPAKLQDLESPEEYPRYEQAEQATSAVDFIDLKSSETSTSHIILDLPKSSEYIDESAPGTEASVNTEVKEMRVPLQEARDVTEISNVPRSLETCQIIAEAADHKAEIPIEMDAAETQTAPRESSQISVVCTLPAADAEQHDIPTAGRLLTTETLPEQPDSSMVLSHLSETFPCLRKLIEASELRWGPTLHPDGSGMVSAIEGQSVEQTPEKLAKLADEYPSVKECLRLTNPDLEFGVNVEVNHSENLSSVHESISKQNLVSTEDDLQKRQELMSGYPSLPQLLLINDQRKLLSDEPQVQGTSVVQDLSSTLCLDYPSVKECLELNNFKNTVKEKQGEPDDQPCFQHRIAGFNTNAERINETKSSVIESGTDDFHIYSETKPAEVKRSTESMHDTAEISVGFPEAEEIHKVTAIDIDDYFDREEFPESRQPEDTIQLHKWTKEQTGLVKSITIKAESEITGDGMDICLERRHEANVSISQVDEDKHLMKNGFKCPGDDLEHDSLLIKSETEPKSEQKSDFLIAELDSKHSSNGISQSEHEYEQESLIIPVQSETLQKTNTDFNKPELVQESSVIDDRSQTIKIDSPVDEKTAAKLTSQHSSENIGKVCDFNLDAGASHFQSLCILGELESGKLKMPSAVIYRPEWSTNDYDALVTYIVGGEEDKERSKHSPVKESATKPTDHHKKHDHSRGHRMKVPEESTTKPQRAVALPPNLASRAFRSGLLDIDRDDEVSQEEDYTDDGFTVVESRRRRRLRSRCSSEREHDIEIDVSQPALELDKLLPEQKLYETSHLESADDRSEEVTLVTDSVESLENNAIQKCLIPETEQKLAVESLEEKNSLAEMDQHLSSEIELTLKSSETDRKAFELNTEEAVPVLNRVDREPLVTQATEKAVETEPLLLHEKLPETTLTVPSDSMPVTLAVHSQETVQPTIEQDISSDCRELDIKDANTEQFAGKMSAECFGTIPANDNVQVELDSKSYIQESLLACSQDDSYGDRNSDALLQELTEAETCNDVPIVADLITDNQHLPLTESIAEIPVIATPVPNNLTESVPEENVPENEQMFEEDIIIDREKNEMSKRIQEALTEIREDVLKFDTMVTAEDEEEFIRQSNKIERILEADLETVDNVIPEIEVQNLLDKGEGDMKIQESYVKDEKTVTFEAEKKEFTESKPEEIVGDVVAIEAQNLLNKLEDEVNIQESQVKDEKTVTFEAEKKEFTESKAEEIVGDVVAIEAQNLLNKLEDEVNIQESQVKDEKTVTFEAEKKEFTESKAEEIVGDVVAIEAQNLLNKLEDEVNIQESQLKDEKTVTFEAEKKEFTESKAEEIVGDVVAIEAQNLLNKLEDEVNIQESKLKDEKTVTFEAEKKEFTESKAEEIVGDVVAIEVQNLLNKLEDEVNIQESKLKDEKTVTFEAEKKEFTESKAEEIVGDVVAIEAQNLLNKLEDEVNIQESKLKDEKTVTFEAEEKQFIDLKTQEIVGDVVAIEAQNLLNKLEDEVNIQESKLKDEKTVTFEAEEKQLIDLKPQEAVDDVIVVTEAENLLDKQEDEMKIQESYLKDEKTVAFEADQEEPIESKPLEAKISHTSETQIMNEAYAPEVDMLKYLSAIKTLEYFESGELQLKPSMMYRPEWSSNDYDSLVSYIEGEQKLEGKANQVKKVSGSRHYKKKDQSPPYLSESRRNVSSPLPPNLAAVAFKHHQFEFEVEFDESVQNGEGHLSDEGDDFTVVESRKRRRLRSRGSSERECVVIEDHEIHSPVDLSPEVEPQSSNDSQKQSLTYTGDQVPDTVQYYREIVCETDKEAIKISDTKSDAGYIRGQPTYLLENTTAVPAVQDFSPVEDQKPGPVCKESHTETSKKVEENILKEDLSTFGQYFPALCKLNELEMGKVHLKSTIEHLPELKKDGIDSLVSYIEDIKGDRNESDDAHKGEDAEVSHKLSNSQSEATSYLRLSGPDPAETESVVPASDHADKTAVLDTDDTDSDQSLRKYSGNEREIDAGCFVVESRKQEPEHVRLSETEIPDQYVLEQHDSAIDRENKMEVTVDVEQSLSHLELASPENLPERKLNVCLLDAQHEIHESNSPLTDLESELGSRDTSNIEHELVGPICEKVCLEKSENSDKIVLPECIPVGNETDNKSMIFIAEPEKHSKEQIEPTETSITKNKEEFDIQTCEAPVVDAEKVIETEQPTAESKNECVLEQDVIKTNGMSVFQLPDKIVVDLEICPTKPVIEAAQPVNICGKEILEAEEFIEVNEKPVSEMHNAPVVGLASHSAEHEPVVEARQQVSFGEMSVFEPEIIKAENESVEGLLEVHTPPVRIPELAHTGEHLLLAESKLLEAQELGLGFDYFAALLRLSDLETGRVQLPHSLQHRPEWTTGNIDALVSFIEGNANDDRKQPSRHRRHVKSHEHFKADEHLEPFPHSKEHAVKVSETKALPPNLAVRAFRSGLLDVHLDDDERFVDEGVDDRGEKDSGFTVVETRKHRRQRQRLSETENQEDSVIKHRDLVSEQESGDGLVAKSPEWEENLALDPSQNKETTLEFGEVKVELQTAEANILKSPSDVTEQPNAYANELSADQDLVRDGKQDLVDNAEHFEDIIKEHVEDAKEQVKEDVEHLEDIVKEHVEDAKEQNKDTEQVECIAKEQVEEVKHVEDAKEQVKVAEQVECIAKEQVEEAEHLEGIDIVKEKVSDVEHLEGVKEVATDIKFDQEPVSDAAQEQVKDAAQEQITFVDRVEDGEQMQVADVRVDFVQDKDAELTQTTDDKIDQERVKGIEEEVQKISLNQTELGQTMPVETDQGLLIGKGEIFEDEKQPSQIDTHTLTAGQLVIYQQQSFQPEIQSNATDLAVAAEEPNEEITSKHQTLQHGHHLLPIINNTEAQLQEKEVVLSHVDCQVDKTEPVSRLPEDDMKSVEGHLKDEFSNIGSDDKQEQIVSEEKYLHGNTAVDEPVVDTLSYFYPSLLILNDSENGVLQEKPDSEHDSKETAKEVDGLGVAEECSDLEKSVASQDDKMLELKELSFIEEHFTKETMVQELSKARESPDIIEVSAKESATGIEEQAADAVGAETADVKEQEELIVNGDQSALEKSNVKFISTEANITLKEDEEKLEKEDNLCLDKSVENATVVCVEELALATEKPEIRAQLNSECPVEEVPGQESVCPTVIEDKQIVVQSLNEDYRSETEMMNHHFPGLCKLADYESGAVKLKPHVQSFPAMHINDIDALVTYIEGEHRIEKHQQDIHSRSNARGKSHERSKAHRRSKSPEPTAKPLLAHVGLPPNLAGRAFRAGLLGVETNYNEEALDEDLGGGADDDFQLVESRRHRRQRNRSSVEKDVVDDLNSTPVEDQTELHESLMLTDDKWTPVTKEMDDQLSEKSFIIAEETQVVSQSLSGESQTGCEQQDSVPGVLTLELEESNDKNVDQTLEVKEVTVTYSEKEMEEVPVTVANALENEPGFQNYVVDTFENKPEIQGSVDTSVEKEPTLQENLVSTVEKEPECQESAVTTLEKEPDIGEPVVDTLEGEPDVQESSDINIEMKPTVEESFSASLEKEPKVHECTVSLETKPDAQESDATIVNEQEVQVSVITAPEKDPAVPDSVITAALRELDVQEPIPTLETGSKVQESVIASSEEKPEVKEPVVDELQVQQYVITSLEKEPEAQRNFDDAFEKEPEFQKYSTPTLETKPEIEERIVASLEMECKVQDSVVADLEKEPEVREHLEKEPELQEDIIAASEENSEVQQPIVSLETKVETQESAATTFETEPEIQESVVTSLEGESLILGPLATAVEKELERKAEVQETTVSLETNAEIKESAAADATFEKEPESKEAIITSLGQESVILEPLVATVEKELEKKPEFQETVVNLEMEPAIPESVVTTFENEPEFQESGVTTTVREPEVLEPISTLEKESKSQEDLVDAFKKMPEFQKSVPSSLEVKPDVETSIVASEKEMEVLQSDFATLQKEPELRESTATLENEPELHATNDPGLEKESEVQRSIAATLGREPEVTESIAGLNQIQNSVFDTLERDLKVKESFVAPVDTAEEDKAEESVSVGVSKEVTVEKHETKLLDLVPPEIDTVWNHFPALCRLAEYESGLLLVKPESPKYRPEWETEDVDALVTYNEGDSKKPHVSQKVLAHSKVRDPTKAHNRSEASLYSDTHTASTVETRAISLPPNLAGKALRAGLLDITAVFDNETVNADDTNDNDEYTVVESRSHRRRRIRLSEEKETVEGDQVLTEDTADHPVSEGVDLKLSTDDAELKFGVQESSDSATECQKDIEVLHASAEEHGNLEISEQSDTLDRTVVHPEDVLASFSENMPAFEHQQVVPAHYEDNSTYERECESKPAETVAFQEENVLDTTEEQVDRFPVEEKSENTSEQYENIISKETEVEQPVPVLEHIETETRVQESGTDLRADEIAEDTLASSESVVDDGIKDFTIAEQRENLLTMTAGVEESEVPYVGCHYPDAELAEMIEASVTDGVEYPSAFEPNENFEFQKQILGDVVDEEFAALQSSLSEAKLEEEQMQAFYRQDTLQLGLENQDDYGQDMDIDLNEAVDLDHPTEFIDSQINYDDKTEFALDEHFDDMPDIAAALDEKVDLAYEVPSGFEENFGLEYETSEKVEHEIFSDATSSYNELYFKMSENELSFGDHSNGTADIPEVAQGTDVKDDNIFDFVNAPETSSTEGVVEQVPKCKKNVIEVKAENASFSSCIEKTEEQIDLANTLCSPNYSTERIIEQISKSLKKKVISVDALSSKSGSDLEHFEPVTAKGTSEREDERPETDLFVKDTSVPRDFAESLQIEHELNSDTRDAKESSSKFKPVTAGNICDEVYDNKDQDSVEDCANLANEHKNTDTVFSTENLSNIHPHAEEKGHEIQEISTFTSQVESEILQSSIAISQREPEFKDMASHTSNKKPENEETAPTTSQKGLEVEDKVITTLHMSGIEEADFTACQGESEIEENTITTYLKEPGSKTESEIEESVVITSQKELQSQETRSALQKEPEIEEAVLDSPQKEPEIAEIISASSQELEFGEIISAASQKETKIEEIISATSQESEVGEIISATAQEHEIREIIAAASQKEPKIEEIISATSQESEVGEIISATAQEHEIREIIAAASQKEPKIEEIISATSEESEVIETISAASQEPIEKIISATSQDSEVGEIIPAAEIEEIISATSQEPEIGEIISAASQKEPEVEEIISATSQEPEIGEIISATSQEPEFEEIISATSQEPEIGEIISAASQKEPEAEVIFSATSQNEPEIENIISATSQEPEMEVIISATSQKEPGIAEIMSATSLEPEIREIISATSQKEPEIAEIISATSHKKPEIEDTSSAPFQREQIAEVIPVPSTRDSEIEENVFTPLHALGIENAEYSCQTEPRIEEDVIFTQQKKSRIEDTAVVTPQKDAEIVTPNESKIEENATVTSQAELESQKASDAILPKEFKIEGAVFASTYKDPEIEASDLSNFEEAASASLHEPDSDVEGLSSSNVKEDEDASHINADAKSVSALETGLCEFRTSPAVDEEFSLIHSDFHSTSSAMPFTKQHESNLDFVAVCPFNNGSEVSVPSLSSECFHSLDSKVTHTEIPSEVVHEPIVSDLAVDYDFAKVAGVNNLSEQFMEPIASQSSVSALETCPLPDVKETTSPGAVKNRNKKKKKKQQNKAALPADDHSDLDNKIEETVTEFLHEKDSYSPLHSERIVAEDKQESLSKKTFAALESVQDEFLDIPQMSLEGVLTETEVEVKDIAREGKKTVVDDKENVPLVAETKSKKKKKNKKTGQSFPISTVENALEVRDSFSKPDSSIVDDEENELGASNNTQMYDIREHSVFSQEADFGLTSTKATSIPEAENDRAKKIENEMAKTVESSLLVFSGQQTEEDLNEELNSDELQSAFSKSETTFLSQERILPKHAKPDGGHAVEAKVNDISPTIDRSGKKSRKRNKVAQNSEFPVTSLPSSVHQSPYPSETRMSVESDVFSESSNLASPLTETDETKDVCKANLASKDKKKLPLQMCETSFLVAQQETCEINEDFSEDEDQSPVMASRSTVEEAQMEYGIRSTVCAVRNSAESKRLRRRRKRTRRRLRDRGLLPDDELLIPGSAEFGKLALGASDDAAKSFQEVLMTAAAVRGRKRRRKVKTSESKSVVLETEQLDVVKPEELIQKEAAFDVMNKKVNDDSVANVKEQKPLQSKHSTAKRKSKEKKKATISESTASTGTTVSPSVVKPVDDILPPSDQHSHQSKDCAEKSSVTGKCKKAKTSDQSVFSHELDKEQTESCGVLQVPMEKMNQKSKAKKSSDKKPGKTISLEVNGQQQIETKKSLDKQSLKPPDTKTLLAQKPTETEGEKFKSQAPKLEQRKSLEKQSYKPEAELTPKLQQTETKLATDTQFQKHEMPKSSEKGNLKKGSLQSGTKISGKKGKKVSSTGSLSDNATAEAVDGPMLSSFELVQTPTELAQVYLDHTDIKQQREVEEKPCETGAVASTQRKRKKKKKACITASTETMDESNYENSLLPSEEKLYHSGLNLNRELPEPEAVEGGINLCEMSASFAEIVSDETEKKKLKKKKKKKNGIGIITPVADAEASNGLFPETNVCDLANDCTGIDEIKNLKDGVKEFELSNETDNLLAHQQAMTPADGSKAGSKKKKKKKKTKLATNSAEISNLTEEHGEHELVSPDMSSDQFSKKSRLLEKDCSKTPVNFNQSIEETKTMLAISTTTTVPQHLKTDLPVSSCPVASPASRGQCISSSDFGDAVMIDFDRQHPNTSAQSNPLSESSSCDLSAESAYESRDQQLGTMSPPARDFEIIPLASKSIDLNQREDVPESRSMFSELSQRPLLVTRKEKAQTVSDPHTNVIVTVTEVLDLEFIEETEVVTVIESVSDPPRTPLETWSNDRPKMSPCVSPATPKLSDESQDSKFLTGLDQNSCETKSDPSSIGNIADCEDASVQSDLQERPFTVSSISSDIPHFGTGHSSGMDASSFILATDTSKSSDDCRQLFALSASDLNRSTCCEDSGLETSQFWISGDGSASISTWPSVMYSFERPESGDSTASIRGSHCTPTWSSEGGRDQTSVKSFGTNQESFNDSLDEDLTLKVTELQSDEGSGTELGVKGSGERVRCPILSGDTWDSLSNDSLEVSSFVGVASQPESSLENVSEDSLMGSLEAGWQQVPQTHDVSGGTVGISRGDSSGAPSAIPEKTKRKKKLVRKMHPHGGDRAAESDDENDPKNSL